MKTDSIFYQLFQTFPNLLFELIGETSKHGKKYQFLSQEVKELSRRFDGLFLPPSDEDPIYFVEVQIQSKEDFYWRFFAEIFVYLGQYQPQQDWCAVALFSSRKVAPGLPNAYRALKKSRQLKVLYLDELKIKEESSLGLGIVQLIVRKEKEVREAIVPTQKLMAKARRTLEDSVLQQKVLELIGTVLVYKFTALSRVELEAMFGLEELKQTRYFQEVGAEFEQRGKERGIKLGKLESIPGLLALGLTLEQIATALNLNVEEVQKFVSDRSSRQESESTLREELENQDAIAEAEKRGKLKSIPKLFAIGLTLEQIATALDLDIEDVRKIVQNEED